MKKLALYWLARKLDKLRINDPRLYMAIVTALTTVEGLVSDPDFVHNMHVQFPGAYWVTFILRVLPTFIAGILKPSTRAHVDEFRRLQSQYINGL